MFNVCGHCGMYTPEKEVRGNMAVCPFCGGETFFVKQPLFLLSGACGVGKTEVCRHLPALTQEVVALEGDILWESRYNTPENKYRPYREMWLRVCKNISQVGRPCLLCGCADPDQFEPCVERRYFKYASLSGSCGAAGGAGRPAALPSRLAGERQRGFYQAADCL